MFKLFAFPFFLVLSIFFCPPVRAEKAPADLRYAEETHSVLFMQVARPLFLFTPLELENKNTALYPILNISTGSVLKVTLSDLSQDILIKRNYLYLEKHLKNSQPIQSIYGWSCAIQIVYLSNSGKDLSENNFPLCLSLRRLRENIRLLPENAPEVRRAFQLYQSRNQSSELKKINDKVKSAQKYKKQIDQSVEI